MSFTVLLHYNYIVASEITKTLRCTFNLLTIGDAAAPFERSFAKAVIRGLHESSKDVLDLALKQ